LTVKPLQVGGTKMRAETESTIAEIEQAMGVLRRHL
jgi:hypothetical protein